jgi:hypothetical protein
LNFVLWRGSLLIYHAKYIKDGKVLAPLGLQSKVLAQGIFRGEQKGAGHLVWVTGSDITGSGPDRE